MRRGLLFALLFAGCGGSTTPTDAGTDMPTPIDAGGLDAPDTGGGPCTTDADSDGHRAMACGGDDCDDGDPNRYPGNHEVCDATGHDEDCDPGTYGYRDDDGDGYADARCCNTGPGGMTCGPDCDDQSAVVHPTAPEVCNMRDDNCDGLVDEGVLVSYYADCDGDGHGIVPPATPSCMRDAVVMACSAPTGWVTGSDDCDDTRDDVHPGATERCDGLDNDCDGVADDGATIPTYYADLDGDGWVVAATATATCTPPPGYVVPPPARDPAMHAGVNDCDDTNASIHPGATDACGEDLNCDFVVGGGMLTWYLDCDGDGYAASTTGSMTTCTMPPTPTCPPAPGCGVVVAPRWTTTAPDVGTTDCDDGHPSVHPTASEVCDGFDTDCNPATTVPGDGDADGDGWPACAGVCTADCNDAVASVHPTATETIGNAVDDDCDGNEICYVDGDHDGARTSATVTTGDIDCTASMGHARTSASSDCCDADALAHPGQTSYFLPPRAGCGGWDFDCNGSDDRQYTATFTSCSYMGIACISSFPTPQWTAGVPPCGASGGAIVGCTMIFTTCMPLPSAYPQYCR